MDNGKCIILPLDYEGKIKYETVEVDITSCLNKRRTEIRDCMKMVTDSNNKTIYFFATYDYTDDEEDRSHISSHVGEYIVDIFNAWNRDPMVGTPGENFINEIESYDDDGVICHKYHLKVHIWEQL